MVYLAQCLCPQRHCLLALPMEQEDPATAEAFLRVQLTTLLNLAIDHYQWLNPWCELCKAPRAQWHIEVGRTRFTTLAEALPHLKHSEADQLASAREIKAARN